MNIMLNGEQREFEDGITLGALIQKEGVLEKVMAAAVNMQIVKKEDWNSRKLEEGDKIELLQFVGGG
ncbi:MAG: sulfur carrier protein ThiS [Campylobacterales bacterium]|nr:sulfur carrier protein ThiS [Campylobacterales bacterium]